MRLDLLRMMQRLRRPGAMLRWPAMTALIMIVVAAAGCGDDEEVDRGPGAAQIVVITYVQAIASGDYDRACEQFSKASIKAMGGDCETAQEAGVSMLEKADLQKVVRQAQEGAEANASGDRAQVVLNEDSVFELVIEGGRWKIAP